jgi:hypothetical protein
LVFDTKQRSMPKLCLPGFALALAIALSGCGSSSSTSNPTPPTPPPTPAVTVSLNQSTVSVVVKSTSQFTATVKGSSNTSVTWSVDGVSGGNSTVGTIASAGLYTAPPTPGSHTVTATSVAQTTSSAKASVTVITGTAISPISATLDGSTGQGQQFTATVSLSNTAVSWSVDGVQGGNASVGTISSGGLYMPPTTAETHTITATSVADSASAASAAVSVFTLGISPALAALDGATGQAQQFTAAISLSTGVSWSVDGVPGGSSNVGTISMSGLYTPPNSVGTHTITASSVADPAGVASAAISVFTLSVSPQVTTISPSSTQQFSASVQGLNSGAVSWSVNGVAGGGAATGTISGAGLYTAPSALGAYTITASSTADSAASASAAVTVVNVAQAAVLTYHNDDARDGAYLQEVTLTPSNVKSTQFGKLLAYPVDGQIYAQPLYMSQLSIAGGTHDVVFVETQNNSVYAFDADATSSQNAQTFWQDIQIGPPVTVDDTGGAYPNVGILSTPVIDATTNTMYLVSESSPNNPTPFRLYGLDVTTGAVKLGPVVINGTVAGTGGDSSGGEISLETSCYQRMALALDPVTNWLYIAFGSCLHGWVFAYDKETLTFQQVFNATPDGDGGGFWAGGAAPAIDDSTGDVYLLSGVDELQAGNPGIGDPVTNGYNDSFLRLQSNTLSIVTYFTPADNFTLAEWDADLGSGGNVLLPSPSTQPMAIGGGKDGNVFVVNQNDMGGYNPGGANNVVQTVPICTDGYNNIFSTPAYWNGSVYYHCNDSVLQAFSWSSSNTTAPLSTTPTSVGTVTYTSAHGATPSLSANGNINGIIWDIDNSAYTSCGCDPSQSGPSVLHAYDASNVATELYNSSQAANGRDTAGLALKFTVPTIVNGRVFVPTATELDIYGLLAP